MIEFSHVLPLLPPLTLMLNVRGNKESPLSVPTLSSEIVDEKKN